MQEKNMVITIGTKSYTFSPWHPELGRVFAGPFSFDCATGEIDKLRPWLTPFYVVGAAFDGQAGHLIPPDQLQAFFTAHRGAQIVLHGAPFDLEVLDKAASELGLYDQVDRNHIWDVELLHRLLVLGKEGHTAGGEGETTLQRCAETYIGADLAGDITAAEADFIRLGYRRFPLKSSQDIPQHYLNRVCWNALGTHLVFIELSRRLDELLHQAEGAWGFVSDAWLNQQIARWGPQTHHIQLKAAIVLRDITANGLHLDTARQQEVVKHYRERLGTLEAALREEGYCPGTNGAGEALQGVFRRLESEHPELHFPKTEKGQYATSKDALHEVAERIPFVKQLLDYLATNKMLAAFLSKLGGRVAHPSFEVLVRSGRTSSYGEFNAQNLPRDSQVRSCFVPSPGHVFIDADFTAVELVTLAQSCLTQFGLKSRMAEELNAGKDLHRLVAARVTGKPEAEITKEERQDAKAINFGKPGGMSDATMQQYALATYNVRLDDLQVKTLSEAWFSLFPEMVQFLDQDLGLEVAAVFELTPAAYSEHTGRSQFVGHPDNQGAENLPRGSLGGMLLKTVKEEKPETRDCRPYSQDELAFFWTKLGERLDLLPDHLHDQVRQRRPSVELQRAVMALADRAGVFTPTGRLRANANYCAKRNTVFQGLAADGAKLALWKLWRAGFRIVNFVHDEVLIEAKADADLAGEAKDIEQLMLGGMREVVPDVRVGVKHAAMDRWNKDAEAVFDAAGKLLLWQPPLKDR
jgi:hypothetical protein